MIPDYERRGYIYSITLEAEHHGLQFELLQLVVQLLTDMDKSNCLMDYQKDETSLLAEVLLNLGINMDENLVALNKILSVSSDELYRDIEAYKRNPEDPSMSDEDRKIMNNIRDKLDDYIAWLIDAEKNKREIPLPLLGETNVREKLALLKKVDFEQQYQQ